MQSVGGVRLNWEASFGKGYKIQVSDDAETWKEVYKTDEGRGGIDEITFPEVDARYVRMFGTELVGGLVIHYGVLMYWVEHSLVRV